MGALLGAGLGQWISDNYADRQRELELEASLITQISAGSIKLYQEAQDAARAPKTPGQIEQRNKAADRWVLASGSITPLFHAYFEGEERTALPADITDGARRHGAGPAPGARVITHWDRYQTAMYDWAVLGCCTVSPGRRKIVARIHAYVDDFIGPPERTPPVRDPWSALDTATPPDDVYQWLGLYLLRGRGKILSDLKDTPADLD